MEISCVQCDRCKISMNGSEYYVSHEKCEGGIRMAIIKSEHNRPGSWMNHYCGKACLMLALNDMVDEINNSAEARKQERTEVQDSQTSELSDSQALILPAAGEEEDYYEDSLGI